MWAKASISPFSVRETGEAQPFGLARSSTYPPAIRSASAQEFGVCCRSLREVQGAAAGSEGKRNGVPCWRWYPALSSGQVSPAKPSCEPCHRLEHRRDERDSAAAVYWGSQLIHRT